MGGILDVTGVGSVFDLADNIIQRIWPNKNSPEYIAAQTAFLQAKEAGALKQLDDDFQTNIEQIKANAAEAAQPGMHFRDGAGWVCVASFAIAALKSPIEWIATLVGHAVTLPSVDTSTTIPMLFALLGLGGIHAYQQIKTQ